jgi:glycosyltransferase involved in cell wall biosynthesis
MEAFKMKILFFIGTLGAGGKERRLIELLSYLKKNTDYSFVVVLRKDQIDYPAFYKLNIPYFLLTKTYKKGDKTLHLKFYRLCKKIRPDIIHTWGNMPAFVSLLAIILLKIPHINSQITDAPPNIKKWSLQNFTNRINFHFSSKILANSYTGLKAYKAESRKSKVIYNGINFTRFDNLPDNKRVRAQYNLFTSYLVIMVASFSDFKDYNIFLDLAKIIARERDDVTFLAVGDGTQIERIKKRSSDENIRNVVFTGKIDDVESLVDAVDVGLLFSNKSVHGEGLSNSILEYMALGKPVIANNSGGTKEIVENGINGYLITNETVDEIAVQLNSLLDDSQKRVKFGEAGRKKIYESFSIDRMGKEFDNVYKEIMYSVKKEK